jgi:hypothetical protein
MSTISTTSFDFTSIVELPIKKDLSLGSIIAQSDNGAVFDLDYTGNKYRNPKKLVCKVYVIQEEYQKELDVITAATKLFDEIKLEDEHEGPIPKMVKQGSF